MPAHVDDSFDGISDSEEASFGKDRQTATRQLSVLVFSLREKFPVDTTVPGGTFRYIPITCLHRSGSK